MPGNAVAFDYIPDLACTLSLPDDRGVFTNAGLILFQRQSLPTDPVGVLALALSNLAVGSRVNVSIVSTGEVLYDSLAAASTLDVDLPVYAAGSPRNALILRVRKGSEPPYYQPYSTQLTAFIGTYPIYIEQLRDD